MEKIPVEVYEKIYTNLGLMDIKWLRETCSWCCIHLKQPWKTMRLANWDANKVAQFCQDVENKRKDREKLGEGYAGIQLMSVSMDNLEVPGLKRCLKWIGPQEIDVLAFPLLTPGAWEMVTRLLTSRCRKFRLKSCGNSNDLPNGQMPDSWIPGWSEGLEHCRSLHHLSVASDVELYELPTCKVNSVNTLDAHRTAQQQEWIVGWGLDNLTAVVIANRCEHNSKVSYWRKKDGTWNHYQPVRLLSGHIAEVFVSAWNPVQNSILATGSKNGVANLWNLEGSGLPTLDVKPLETSYFSKQDGSDLTSLDWNCDGSLLAIGSYDSILRIITATGKLYFSHHRHEGSIFVTKFSKSGEWLLTASLDGTVCLWNVTDKKLHRQYRSHTDCCLDIVWLDNDTFASCSADTNIHIMNVHEAEPIKMLMGHRGEINQIRCNPSQTRLASCADDQTARIWNLSHVSGGHSPDLILGILESDRVIVCNGHEGSVTSIAWCPRTTDGVDIVATASFDCTVRLWDSITGSCMKVMADHRRPVYALTFSPNGRWLGTGSGDGWMHIYSIETKTKRWGWFSGSEKPGVFDISWQQAGDIDRIALALENHQVGMIDMSQWLEDA